MSTVLILLLVQFVAVPLVGLGLAWWWGTRRERRLGSPDA